jgi:hypothetical protein
MQPSDPYGPPPAGPNPPPPPDHAYVPAQRRTNGLAIAALVVSLVSLLSCPFAGAVGIYLGNRARNEIRSTGEDGDGMAQAGIIVGWIAVAFVILWLCFGAIMISSVVYGV